MIKKEIRENILNKFTQKKDKIFASLIIDKITKFENCSYVVFTSFLDLNEKEIAIFILNKLNIKYYIFSPLEDTSRFVIFLIPNYVEDVSKVYDEYISCIKIKPAKNSVIIHRECMGAIYSLGLKNDMIGDIFIYNNTCYFFTLKYNEKYIINNLTSISKYPVIVQALSILENEIKGIRINYEKVEITVQSLRIDAILSQVFNISREQVKQKIQKGDLFINSKEMYFIAYTVKKDDIVSLKRCGKVKIGEVVRNTKSGKVVINIYKYN